MKSNNSRGNYRKVKNKESMEMEEEERRREAAMVSTPCLQPNFKPRGVTEEQLSKFQELHKRRLQVKSKSKFKTKPKGKANKSQGNYLTSQNSGAEDLNVDKKEPSLWKCEGFDSRNESSLSLEQDNVSVLSASKKQKLHWGLDTKERWERKSNM